MEPKKTSIKPLNVIVFFAFLFLIVYQLVRKEESNLNANGTPKTEREAQLSKYFSAWDGSNPTLERLIKNAMNDPDSYEHIETVYWDMTDHIIVRTVYSGNNAFGGRVKNFVKAKLDNEGELVEIIEEGAGNG